MQINRTIAIILVLMITVLFAYFLVMPQYRSFKALQTDLAIKTAEYNAKFEYYNEIGSLYLKLQTYKEDLAKIDDALPKDRDFGQIIYYMHYAASESGVMIKSLTLSKGGAQKNQAEDSIKEEAFSLSILGNYKALEHFLVALQNSTRIFEVTSITFGSGSQVPLAPNQSQFEMQQTYNFSLAVKAFSY